MNLQGLRVLVIDDHPDAADLMALGLKDYGASTKVAYSFDALTELVDTFDPQLIALDLVMPRISGFEACRTVRSIKGDSVYIVAVTGYADVDPKMLDNAGFDTHLLKPVAFEVIAALGESVLKRARE